MGLIATNRLTTNHHDPKGVNDAITLLGRDHCVDYTQTPLTPVKQFKVNNRENTPPFLGAYLLSHLERIYFEHANTPHRRTGGTFAVHAR